MRAFFNTVRLIAGVTALTVIGVSCSVKENRVPCPCYLNVSFRERESIHEEGGILAWSDAEVFRSSIPDVQKYDPYWVKTVRKGEFDLSAWKGAFSNTADGTRLLIKKGEQCDPLYAYFTPVDATGEMAYADVDFKKQYATITVDICKKAEEMRDFEFKVTSNTCGFDLFTFAPVPGDFEFYPIPEAGERVFSFRAPRQIDNSMSLQMWYRGVTAGIYPLGEYIHRVGYDWKTEELKDVRILIDLVIGQVTIAVEGWESGAVFQLIKQ